MSERPAEAGVLHGGSSGPNGGRQEEAEGLVDMDPRAEEQDQLHDRTRSTDTKPNQLDSRTQEQDRVPAEIRTGVKGEDSTEE